MESAAVVHACISKGHKHQKEYGVYESIPGLSQKHHSEVCLKTSPNMDMRMKGSIAIDVPGLHDSES